MTVIIRNFLKEIIFPDSNRNKCHVLRADQNSYVRLDNHNFKMSETLSLERFNHILSHTLWNYSSQLGKAFGLKGPIFTFFMMYVRIFVVTYDPLVF